MEPKCNSYNNTESFPDWSVEEFDAIQEEHTFSTAYKLKKKKITKEYIKSKAPRFRPFGLPAAASVALMCTLGAATVFAAAGIYHLTVDKTAPHRAEIQLEVDTASEANEVAEAVAASSDAVTELPEVTVAFGYLPDGLVRSSYLDNENYYVGADGGYGYYTDVLAADTTAGWTETFVSNAENLTISGRDAVLVETQLTYDTSKVTRDLYVSFPEVGRIVHIKAWGSESSRDELLKIAENISLEETGSMVAVSELYAWSRYVAVLNNDPEIMAETMTAAGEEMSVDEAVAALEKENSTVPVFAVTGEEMSNLHSIGESFMQLKPNQDGMSYYETPIEITVKDACVYDDLSALTNKDQIPEEWLSLLDEDGKLMTDALLCVQYGDGEETLSTIVSREEKELKLLQVTVQYTNKGDTDQEDFLFGGQTMCLSNDDGNWRILQPGDNTEYSLIHETPCVGIGNMWYYDQTGGENNNNYITLLKAGETHEIKMAWIVDADSLDKIYLNLNTAGDYSSFTEFDMAMGYVDLDL